MESMTYLYLCTKASVCRFLDGLCSGSNNDSASATPLLRLIRRVDISPGSVSILLDRNTFAACLSMGPERIREDALRIHAPFRLRRRGVETKLVLGNPTKSVDRTLLRNIANGCSVGKEAARGVQNQGQGYRGIAC